jgi:hypothetical protein
MLYPNTPSEFSFFTLSAGKKSPIHRDITMEEVGKSTEAIRLTTNGPKELLWNLLVMPCQKNPTKHVAVVMSISHALGDGSSFYEIHKMLCCTKDVQALIVYWIVESEVHQTDALGYSEYHYVNDLFLTYYGCNYWYDYESLDIAGLGPGNQIPEFTS